MSPLPEVIIAVLAPFAGLFSSAVWGHAQVSVIGAILCQGPHTVAATLRVMGLGQEPWFERYHRVLNRARWSGLQFAGRAKALRCPTLVEFAAVPVGHIRARATRLWTVQVKADCFAASRRV